MTTTSTVSNEINQLAGYMNMRIINTVPLTVGQVAFGAIGALVLYYAIPARKRKNIFK
ncbi:hypothetical protein AAH994_06075 [Weeksellaceae bacterium A-14]